MQKFRFYFLFFYLVKVILKSASSCIKKRGLSCGLNKLPSGIKCKVCTNEYDRPNFGDTNYKALACTSIGIMARTYIHIIYQDFQDVPH